VEALQPIPPLPLQPPGLCDLEPILHPPAQGTDRAPWRRRFLRMPRELPTRATQSGRLFGSSTLAIKSTSHRRTNWLQRSSCACRPSRPLSPEGLRGQWAAAPGRLAAGESLSWGDLQVNHIANALSPPLSNHQQPSNRRPHRMVLGQHRLLAPFEDRCDRVAADERGFALSPHLMGSA
jgi:hypothetical protein